MCPAVTRRREVKGGGGGAARRGARPAVHLLHHGACLGSVKWPAATPGACHAHVSGAGRLLCPRMAAHRATWHAAAPPTAAPLP
eukprot:117662-Chlamydomonas_euryale.AAC.2